MDSVHVGTAMFCQVGSDVCVNFEVKLYQFPSCLKDTMLQVLFKPDLQWIKNIMKKI